MSKVTLAIIFTPCSQHVFTTKLRHKLVEDERIRITNVRGNRPQTDYQQLKLSLIKLFHL